MSSSAPQPRQPKGVPSGGQWDTYDHASDDVHLLADATLSGRAEALRAGGYVPPVFMPAADDPRSTDRIAQYWDQHFIGAEHNAPREFPQMPDDYGSASSGRALSGRRRVNRQLYQGAGVAVRMPSATKTKEYANEVQGTFLLPVSVTDDETGRSHSGWAAVTKTGPASWSVSAPFMDPATNAKISESVATVLEARRPRAALRSVGSLLDRHRARLASNGAELNQVTSTWVSAVGYDQSQSAMVMKTSRGDVYGYQVDRNTYESVRGAASPGRVVNKLLKGSGKGVQVGDCGSCGRVYVETNGHRCPVDAFEAPKRTHRRGNKAATRRATRLAERVFQRRDG
ncbi:hypothetical protein [Aeromicrobium sp. CTD01-1L150]|uniref:hypothetical protein n=1 Tax=Aeromicrobium sp. CTD01-1L150 TaxID=3341830 RepID=UPI0035C1DD8D